MQLSNKTLSFKSRQVQLNQYIQQIAKIHMNYHGRPAKDGALSSEPAVGYWKPKPHAQKAAKHLIWLLASHCSSVPRFPI